MTRRIVMGTMVMAASLLSSGAVYAQPAAMHVPVHAIFAKSKTVSFTLRNDTKETVELSVNGSTMSLAPGKSANVKAIAGEKVLAANTTEHYAQGTVIVVASAAIADAAIVLH